MLYSFKANSPLEGHVTRREKVSYKHRIYQVGALRYSQEAISRLVMEQHSSGKTALEFCAARGLNSEVLYFWRQRARKQSLAR